MHKLALECINCKKLNCTSRLRDRPYLVAKDCDQRFTFSFRINALVNLTAPALYSCAPIVVGQRLFLIAAAATVDYPNLSLESFLASAARQAVINMI